MNRYAFVFPGQGAQHPGMGRELAAGRGACGRVFEQADSVLEFPLSALCFGQDAAALALTENTQPAVLTVCVAALRALQEHGLRPAAAAGHSLGEYAAHVAAGTLEFADALRAVRARGRFMQEAVPPGVGAMNAVVGLDAAQVVAACADAAEHEVVEAANFNEPKQTVISGHSAAVGRAAELARQRGARRALQLPVSAPFHCSLMEPAALRLVPVLEAIAFRDCELPVYTNVDARPVEQAAASREALLRQVASPVRWHELIERMLADGIETFVEIGPGKVLSGLIRKIHRPSRVFNVSDPDGVEQVVEQLHG